MADNPPKRRQAYADIGSAARDANIADSCSSLDEFGQPWGGNGGAEEPYGRHYGGGSNDGGGGGVLEWEADGENEPPEPPNGQFSRFRCRSGASSIAIICLLLTMGSFMVPESEDGIGAVVKKVKDLHGNAVEDAQYHGQAFVAKLRGQRHCRTPPHVLRKNATRQVSPVLRTLRHRSTCGQGRCSCRAGRHLGPTNAPSAILHSGR